MYLVLLWNAAFHPRRTMSKIICPHDREDSMMVDGGMKKMWWCRDCDATWFSTGTAA